ncbi:MAG: hypothetical protein AAF702_26210 [Chloroflexota bacterium]
MNSNIKRRRRVLIGTVGYHLLRDYSIGPNLLPQLQAMDWPVGAVVDEMNWGPVAIVQQFETLPEPYDRVIILTATDLGKAPGIITLRLWRGGLPTVDQIQDRVSEAVTGTISAENLLIIGEHFDIWPEETLLVDVQPGLEEAGETFTAEIEAVVPQVLNTLQSLASVDYKQLHQLSAVEIEEIRGNELADVRR